MKIWHLIAFSLINFLTVMYFTGHSELNLDQKIDLVDKYLTLRLDNLSHNLIKVQDMIEKGE